MKVYDEADDETFYGYCKDELKSFVYRVYGEMDDLGDDIYLNAITTGVINQYSFMPKPVVPDKFILDESNGDEVRQVLSELFSDLTEAREGKMGRYK